MLTHIRTDERGSMPLVILASIIVAGLVTVLFTSVLASQRITRFDKDYTRAFHGADAGMQAALAQIRSLDPDGDYSGGPLEAPTDAANGDVVYEYTATKVDREWEVRAYGEVNGDRRFLEATVTRPSRFFLAAFGKTLVGFKGGNVASSYDGSGNVDTGNGAVGTNGDVELNGTLSYDASGNCTGNTCVDLMFLFGDSAECTKTTSNCSQIVGTWRENRESDPYIPETEFIEDALEASWCQAAITPWVASVDGPLVGGAGPGPAGEYCFSSMSFDVNTSVDATGGDVEAYVSGDVTSSNQVKINCQGCIDRGFGTSVTEAQIEEMLANDPPDSTTLQIYSTGTSVTLGNHTHMGAAVYAPNASCHGNPSNSQGYIYGSMLCNDINNQGGWSFWFDERLEDIGTSEWRISGVREEFSDTSSF